MSEPFPLEVGLSFDYWAAGIFFNKLGITVSTLSGIVRDGKDAPLKLYGWQRAFLKWLAPRLSKAHTDAALKSDIARAKLALALMGG